MKYDSYCNIKYHNFPQSPELQQLWLEKCGLTTKYPDMKVCSDHFTIDDYDCVCLHGVETNEVIRKLKPTAYPHCNLGSSTTTKIPLKFKDVKIAVDENKRLKQELQDLQKEAEILLKKTQVLEKRQSKRKMSVVKVKKKYDNLKRKSNSTKDHKNILSKVFSAAQVGVLIGKEKIFWSNDDLAMAFTLRQMGNKQSYLYLKETLNFPLPALSCVQKWVTAKAAVK